MILDKIPAEYKQFILDLLKRPELKECLEENELDEFYKRLKRIKAVEFKPLKMVWDEERTGDYGFPQYVIYVDGKENILGPANEGIWQADIRDLVIKIVSELIHEAGFFNNHTFLSPNEFKGDTKLTKYTVSETVRSIPEKCFEDCSNLEEITLPSNCTEIRSEAFKDCSSLKKIIIKSPKINFGNDCFGGCNQLEEIYAANPKAITQNKMDKAFRWGWRPLIKINGDFIDPMIGIWRNNPDWDDESEEKLNQRWSIDVIQL